MTTATRLTAIASQTIGPFFHFGIASDTSLGCIAPRLRPGQGSDSSAGRIRLTMRVLDGDRAPVNDALIEVYQPDGDGHYDRAGFCGFGRLPTGDDGSCVFETIRPGSLPDGRGGWQAAHIDVCLFARGILRHLYTRVYFEDDWRLAQDPMLSLVPEHRRGTLIAQPVPDAPGQWWFDIRLQGERETVFFDL
jgi:protocatechuate 3,4-dioxygenase alpha subunit